MISALLLLKLISSNNRLTSIQLEDVNMKKNYEEPIFNIARFTLKDALLAQSGDPEGSIGTDGDSSGSGGDKDPGDILG